MTTIKNYETGETITRDFTESQLAECIRDGFEIVGISDEKMNIIASYMDDEKREQVHFELAPCSHEEFLKRYLELDPDFEELLSNEFGIEL